MNMIYTYLGNETQLVQNVNVAGAVSDSWPVLLHLKHVHRHIQRRYVYLFVLLYFRYVDFRNVWIHNIQLQQKSWLKNENISTFGSWVGLDVAPSCVLERRFNIWWGQSMKFMFVLQLFLKGLKRTWKDYIYIYTSTFWCVVSGKFVWHKLQHLNSLILDCQLRICCHPALEFWFHHRGPRKKSSSLRYPFGFLHRCSWWFQLTNLNKYHESN